MFIYNFRLNEKFQDLFFSDEDIIFPFIKYDHVLMHLEVRQNSDEMYTHRECIHLSYKKYK